MGTTGGVAHVHTPKAGQWAKRQAGRIRDRVFVGVAIGLMAQGLVIGFCLARFTPWVASGLMLAWFGGLGVAARLVSRHLDKAAVERLRYLRGGQAEGLVAWYLHDLPDGWHVFHNLPCATGGDVDHVAVGPGGLFVISTKSYKGHVTRTTTGTTLLNGRPLGEMDEAMRLALWVRDVLRAGLGKRVPWVRAVLAVPLAKVDVPPTGNDVWVLGEEDLLAELNPERPRARGGLSKDVVAAVAAELARHAGREPDGSAAAS